MTSSEPLLEDKLIRSEVLAGRASINGGRNSFDNENLTMETLDTKDSKDTKLDITRDTLA
jgi:hypothetical protein